MPARLRARECSIDRMALTTLCRRIDPPVWCIPPTTSTRSRDALIRLPSRMADPRNAISTRRGVSHVDREDAPIQHSANNERKWHPRGHRIFAGEDVARRSRCAGSETRGGSAGLRLRPPPFSRSSGRDMQRSPRLPEDGTSSLTGLLPEDAMNAKVGLTVRDSTRKPPALPCLLRPRSEAFASVATSTLCRGESCHAHGHSSIRYSPTSLASRTEEPRGPNGVS